MAIAEKVPRAPFPVVVGGPRSGTSLLAVMLDSYPALAIPPETAFIAQIASLQGPPEVVREHFLGERPGSRRERGASWKPQRVLG